MRGYIVIYKFYDSEHNNYNETDHIVFSSIDKANKRIDEITNSFTLNKYQTLYEIKVKEVFIETD